MRRLVLYWRIIFFVLLFTLYLANVIDEFILFSIISGIIVFVGVPWLFHKFSDR
ncbi:hypothetical protein [Mesobacillus maritimus]|uniref:Uncharacterized protein n=1 Tax=Mesobacillus maritimus TaxID=1643336 RepID=A0ABS7K7D4_9BACI|nr:hypothetical protein [Mesobacillus maritimus]MBY0098129.1 hypothetical protein [Mesobacillus maritimus]